MSDVDRRFYEQDVLWRSEALPLREVQRLRETIENLPAGRSLVDVGAGDGRLLRALRDARTHDVTLAVERSFTAIARAEGPRVVGDVSRLPLRDEAVDTLTVCEVLEHLPTEVFAAAVGELQRVARSHILVTVPNDEDLERSMVRCRACRCRFHRYRHLRHFDRHTLASLFPEFELMLVREVGPRELHLPRPVIALARRSKLLPTPSGAPICPQCGFGTVEAAGEDAPIGASGRTAQRPRSVRGRLVGVLNTVAMHPRSPGPRKPPWLLGVYRRRT